jgi:3-hydroxy-9,10-secoandrosta-1,3,5(10)-triene-9,17-dione monooxygenase reductase component
VASPTMHRPTAEVFRHVLGHYPTGVVVVTAMTSEGPVGMAVNSFTSVSLDPPLVLFCPARTSTTWPGLRGARAWAVNLLGGTQSDLSRQFATRAVDRFAGVSWTLAANGAPLLDDALAWLECSPETEHEAGDHTVVIARVQRLAVHTTARDPLIFFCGDYLRASAAAT